MSEAPRVVEVPDLRSAATPPFAPAHAYPAWASSLYGVPFGSPAFAARDAAEMSAPSLVPPRDPIPGTLVTGSLWPGERYVVRVPARWNGSLVVAGTPGHFTEYASDRLFSDPLLARGYAYAAGNKGQGDGAVLLEPGRRFDVDGVALPRMSLPDGRAISFFQHARGSRWERWLEEFVLLARTARSLLADLAGAAPERTYAVGASSGAYQVRRAAEESDLFDGALAWNAVLWSPEHSNLNRLPKAIEATAAGRPQDVEELGFPPDVRGAAGGSLYELNLRRYWRAIVWLFAMSLDPETSVAYGDADDPAAAESWNGRLGAWRMDRTPQVRARIAERIAGFANTGRLRTKLIDLASAHDHVAPPAMHFEPYRAMVAAAGKGALYRGEILPHAQHVDRWSEQPDYPSLRPGHPRVMQAFDELVAWAG